MHVQAITPEVTAITSPADIPTLGTLRVSAFVITGEEPILVDTGLTPDREEFIAAVGKIVDPADLRWIWLTHSDRDHTGAIADLLELAPQARVAATFVTMGLMSVGNQPIPPERAYMVRDGSRVPVAGRELIALRPPLFDNPGTAGFFDPATRVLFSSDFLGGILPSPDAALIDDVAAIASDDVVAGQLLWGSVDAPWAHSLDPSKFAAALDAFRRYQPEIVLSTHLPPIRGGLDRHLETVATLPSTPPTVLPDQAALEAALAGIAHGGA